MFSKFWQNRREIRPACECVRGVIADIFQIFVIERKLILLAECLKGEAMGIIKIIRGRFVLTEIEHRPKRPFSQFVGDRDPVPVHAMLFARCLECCSKTGVPVEDGAASVEGQGFDIS